MEREAFGLENLRYAVRTRSGVLRQRRAEEFLADGVTALFVPPADAHALAEAMRLRLRSDASPQTRRERPQGVRHPSIMGHLYTEDEENLL